MVTIGPLPQHIPPWTLLNVGAPDGLVLARYHAEGNVGRIT